MLFGQHDLGDWAAVNREGLEQLGPRADRLRVLHYDPHRSGAGPVGDLYPVTTVTWWGNTCSELLTVFTNTLLVLCNISITKTVLLGFLVR